MTTQIPTIVLVHGAWADASGWNNVIQRLQGDGFTVLAPPNPLRGLPQDAHSQATRPDRAECQRRRHRKGSANERDV
jgi:pimeloyl-ACP methyl ester carboxylesterase